MLKTHTYYSLKPILPLGLRLALRRLSARLARNRFAYCWPIHQNCGLRPQGWPGWPEGKQFALVMTHDVESEAGLGRCQHLAEIDAKHGIRSSFNFIPEGDYTLESELSQSIVERGFEVGVHDLKHNGKLFLSRESFRRNAVHINRYLSQWNSEGFRSGFMLHRLDWLHDLNILYDASTFDVDPFEPQPDGVNTIFPFWVPAPPSDGGDLRSETEYGGESPGSESSLLGCKSANHCPHPPVSLKSSSRAGYVELPYTLIQDFSLFVILNERNIDIWKRKLDWIARHGGMAMIDTHPDYMCFGQRKPANYEYPLRYYEEFLTHVQTEYGNAYWQALPREVAKYCESFKPRQARPPRNISMVTYSFYESDNRVRRYAETLARRGDHVRVFCLGQSGSNPHSDEDTGVQVIPLQHRNRNERKPLDHAIRLMRFWWRALWALRHRTDGSGSGCELVHAHNIPDFIVFAGLWPKLYGGKILLDLHDLVPELYQDKFCNGKESLTLAFLRKLESLSARFADHVIVANHLWMDKVAARSVARSKLTALVNNVDLNLFYPRKKDRQEGKFIILYPGSLNWHQGLDIAVDALAIVKPRLPAAELRIYGSGPMKISLIHQAEKLGLTESVVIQNEVPVWDIPQLMSNANLGIVPKRAEGFGNEAYSTKIMEFMSQAVPVVVARTKIDQFYFKDDTVCFFEPGSVVDLADKILLVAENKGYQEQLSKNGQAYAQTHSWETMKDVYLNLVDRLTMTSAPRPEKRRKAAMSAKNNA
jgi:glycosyltransferase involved in cell wall biosynthesis